MCYDIYNHYRLDVMARTPCARKSLPNSEHTRQSRPDYGLGLSHFKGKSLDFVQAAPFSQAGRDERAPLLSEKVKTQHGLKTFVP